MALSVDRRTEIQVGTTWTVISGDVREKDAVVIERGAKNESTKPGPSKLTLTLNNRHGRYSPRNPRSPYYGLIGRNTPVRFSVRGPESYLQLDGTTAAYARTPDVSALDITGDLDIRAEATTDWYATSVQTLIGKWVSATAQRSYLLRLEAGLLTLNWSPNGAAFLFAQQVLPAMPRRAAVRATLDVDNGASGWTATFYWAETMAGPWVQIGLPVTVAGVTNVYAGTAPLEVAPVQGTGWAPVRGRVHRAEVRAGIAGTVVASPDMRALAEGTTSWADSAGRTWTVSAGAKVSDREYRFTGEITSWPVRWDTSGSDVWVSIVASGVTRRLGQGQKALQSTLRRRVPSDPDLVAYWPMEDGDGATAAYSPLPGVQPLALDGWDMAADDSLGGAAALPKTKNPASFRGRVPRSTSAGWQVECAFFLPALPAAQAEFLRVQVAGSVMTTAVVSASTAGVRIEALDGTGDSLAFVTFTNAGALADLWGKWNRLAVYTAASAGITYLYVSWRDIAANSRWTARTAFTGAQGAVVGVSGTYDAATTGLVLGHLAVFDIPATSTATTAAPGSSIFSGADDGFTGESAVNRMFRLATEEADQLALTTIDGNLTILSEAMGPQRPGTLLSLIEEAAATDGGILYETRDALALVYRDRTTLYNQRVALALDYTAPGEVPPPLEPDEDDQLLRNDVTVTRRGGSAGRAVRESGPLSVQPPPAGVGTYDEAVTLSLYSDAQPQPIAEWRVHLGTWDEARYPTITVWLHAAPHLVSQVLAMDIGDRLQISNPPPWLPPGVIDQHMRGYTERIGAVEWSLAMNCAPAGPWTVGVLEDRVLGRADTDGSQLAAGVDASATSWSVAVTAGPLWLTTATRPAEFPLDVTCGGEQVRVTGISGTSSPQTFTVVRGVNGITKAHAAGAALSLTNPMRLAL
ncbi:hypothetical protein PV356_30850 [Streptomyces sp. WI03-5b]|uniref:hypothetical protein n=1 Tax=Streptomyces sp. WI03-5b TaxID=462946 RepID=UPI0029AF495D|nr:hypothetical protein [Streptomyces sp. WI03-5b]MDX2623859.1 hypothetical protein [Streptomyces sp. WI03-5b]